MISEELLQQLREWIDERLILRHDSGRDLRRDIFLSGYSRL